MIPETGRYHLEWLHTSKLESSLAFKNRSTLSKQISDNGSSEQVSWVLAESGSDMVTECFHCSQ